MKISRGTIQRLLNSGRKKILDGLLHQKAIKLKNNGHIIEAIVENMVE